jgi:cell division protein FtsW (lipid II flippase)
VRILQQSPKISAYLKIVCEQIRWKKAHHVIAEEIKNHLMDQKNAFIAKGLDEEAATDQAIREMGDPVLVGAQLDRTHRPKIEWSIIVLTSIALLLGLAIRIFVVHVAEMPWMLPNSIMSIVIGIGCMAAAYFLDFTIIGKHPQKIYVGLIILTIGVMIVSPVINNGRSFYASYMLLLFPTVFAGIIYSMRSKGYSGIVFCGVFLAVPLFAGLFNPGFSSMVLYVFTCLILLTLAIAKGWFHVPKLCAVLLVSIPSVVTAWIAIFSSPYRWQRLQNAINPFLDPMGAGYIATKTREIIGGAKFLGQGKLAINAGNLLPNIETDCLLTYLIHGFGWVAFIVIMTVILAFILRSLMLCSSQKSVLGRLVATSVLITYTMQVALYVAYNLGLQLFSPLTLPLISYGGTATVINMLLIGLMLSVFKSGDLVRDPLTSSKVGKNKLLEIVDGKVIIDLHAFSKG